MKAMRLDKYLTLSGEKSRAEAGKLIRSGVVRVNSAVATDPSSKVTDADAVTLAGEVLSHEANQYIMLQKPAGVLTAARDKRAQTVMDLLPQALSKRKVLPVGRLDKDTTGLLLLTNDGVLAHRLLSPKSHVWKKYIATVEGMLDQDDIEAFASGLELSDFVAMPATLCICEAGRESSIGEVTIREGKFHQVKRMFASRGHEVQTLHRVAFGTLTLPGDLREGEHRPLTAEELAALRACAGMSASPDTKEGQDNG